MADVVSRDVNEQLTAEVRREVTQIDRLDAVIAGAPVRLARFESLLRGDAEHLRCPVLFQAHRTEFELAPALTLDPLGDAFGARVS